MQAFFSATKILQSANILLGIGLLSAFAGSVGYSIKQLVNKHIHRCGMRLRLVSVPRRIQQANW
eukprot:COSAG02_NODE_90_length_37755_cov_29.833364_27_plen_64_part_00